MQVWEAQYTSPGALWCEDLRLTLSDARVNPHDIYPELVPLCAFGSALAASPSEGIVSLNLCQGMSQSQ